jgi:D-amino-acid dehydrogenase
MPASVVVIGGGIVGASAAYHLARRGARVTLVDREAPGQATAAGAGIIAPGTSLRPIPAFFPLAYRAVAYYPDLLADLMADGERETGYAVVGLLHVAMDPDEWARLPELARLFRERRDAGAPRIGDVEELDAAAARTLFPALADTHGAVHVTGAARVDGRRLRDAMRRAAARHGARSLTGEAVLVRRGERVEAVRVGGRRLPADAVIVAAGAWAAAFADVLGAPLPIAPQRGQILHLALPNTDTSHWPIVVGFHSHYLLTFPPDRVVVGATREDGSGFDPRVTAGGVREVLSEALRVAPGLARANIAETRVGLRPASPDGLPILGRAPGLENVYVAVGHGPVGLQLGPYSGVLAADLALGLPAPEGLDLAPYAAERFQ